MIYVIIVLVCVVAALAHQWRMSVLEYKRELRDHMRWERYLEEKYDARTSLKNCEPLDGIRVADKLRAIGVAVEGKG